jgi:hypothetical protein
MAGNGACVTKTYLTAAEPTVRCRHTGMVEKCVRLKNGSWSPELRALAAPLLAPVLLHAQQEYGRHLADQRFVDLLASAPPSVDGTRPCAGPGGCFGAADRSGPLSWPQGPLPLPGPSWCPPSPQTRGPGGCHVRVPAPACGG